MGNKEKYTNALIEEDSPYLLQHAHNPVNWLSWSEKSRQKAREENKLILVSIGYSSCHWCHVMESESFEDEAVAQLMNDNFICIKVDREERPDIDQLYMEAVQMMSGQGGWPLNCFTTPDGKPVYGGTYFPKAHWIRILQQLSELWNQNPSQVMSYGEKLADGIEVSGGLPQIEQETSWDLETIAACVQNWKERFDNELGGPDKAPKFPLPSNYIFLMRYSFLKQDEEVKGHVKLTLDKMACGGIYDQVGGGFTRYSTDKEWKVPHFEKMLYDNAQLLALYAEAYAAYGDLEYLTVTQSIKAWLRREMKNGSGGFYSAIDADSEGEEGRFYTWNKDLTELDSNLKKAFEKFYFTDYKGLWEQKIIPVRKNRFSEIATSDNTNTDEIIAEFNDLNKSLLSLREKRIRPLTDDKSLCSWNAMLASGFIKSYRFTKANEDLEEALSILQFIQAHLQDENSLRLKHTWKNGKAKINGFLDDYAFLIAAYIDMYAATFEENWLEKAKELTFLSLDLFFDPDRGLFFYTPSDQADLISRPVELSDNVIPSSNAVMAGNLLQLASYFSLPHFEEKVKRMLKAIEKSMIEYGSGYSQWANLYLQLSLGTPEMAICGSAARQFLSEIRKVYHPFLIEAVAGRSSSLPLLRGRYSEDQTKVYICRHHTCQNPVESFEQGILELKKTFN